MTALGIDIETYSDIDLKKSGVYRYAESENFRVLLFGYAYDDEPVKVIDLAQGEEIPRMVWEDLFDPAITKTAFNANFERVCLAKHFGQAMPPEQWQCTMVHALTLGLPMSLADVGKALNLTVDKQKMSEGKALIRYFCTPQKRRKSQQTTLFGEKPENYNRNLPEHNPEKWEMFKTYCTQDVETERTIRQTLEKYPISKAEHQLWCLDQIMNDYGVLVDTQMVKHAIKCSSNHQRKLEEEAIQLTGLDNPKSVSQIKKWLKDAEGLEVESLNKAAIPGLLKKTESNTVRRVLELRQELSKTSIKKYEAMERSKCSDNRIRGLFQFYGANRSGRWAGRLVQVQNLPQNHLKDLGLARQLLRSGEYETIEMLFGNVPDTLSQLLRTALIAGEGNKFVVSDFSAIEARIIAWMADEEWRMEVFRTHGKIYEASASQMFKVPIEEITKGSPLRQKGKIAELALGYGGSVGALTNMGALKMGLEESELKPLVNVWRETNQKITQLWWDVEEAAMTAIVEKTSVPLHHRLKFTYESGILFITLPSGRNLAYVRPRIENDVRFNKPTITYEGYEQGKWTRLKTYGPKLVENIVQATARDCLAEAMLRLDEQGFRIVMHVHDEVVIEAPEGDDCLEEVCRIMGQPLDWAPGLPLPADGYETYYYMKD
ncbi:DNA polymerase [Syntrophomonas erecta subsp. sporosyntropha]